MKAGNPFEKRIRAYELGKLVESFFGKKNVSWYALGYASLILLAIGWIPDGISDILNCNWSSCHWPACLQCSYKILASLAIIAFFRWRITSAMKYEAKIAVRNQRPQPVGMLGLFLSPVAGSVQEQEAEIPAIRKAIHDRKLVFDFFNKKRWEMPLKAIDFHKSHLNKVVLFTSSGERGTTAMSDDFRKVVQYFYPGIEVVEMVPGGMNFEDVEKVFDAVEAFYEKALHEGFKEDDMLVDITGGQKTNSIAASIATLATGRHFQYISTDTKEVLVYDVRYIDQV
jgi:hypothetical protein